MKPVNIDALIQNLAQPATETGTLSDKHKGPEVGRLRGERSVASVELMKQNQKLLLRRAKEAQRAMSELLQARVAFDTGLREMWSAVGEELKDSISEEMEGLYVDHETCRVYRVQNVHRNILEPSMPDDKRLN